MESIHDIPDLQRTLSDQNDGRMRYCERSEADLSNDSAHFAGAFAAAIQQVFRANAATAVE
jgi:hypothetical protein